MRAIDYLSTRSEVDAERIGCAGHSGGGTLTKFIAVADPRVQCAVILEGNTANQWPTRGIGIADIEQNLFPAALDGVDNVDLHVAIAPRPLLAGIESYNPGFNRAADAIRLRYKQLGVEEKFDTVAADDPHAWTPKLRCATTDWFCRWFYGRRGAQEESAFETSPLADLYCTPNGSLLYSHKGATIFSIPFSGESVESSSRGFARCTRMLIFRRIVRRCVTDFALFCAISRSRRRWACVTLPQRRARAITSRKSNSAPNQESIYQHGCLFPRSPVKRDPQFSILTMRVCSAMAWSTRAGKAPVCSMVSLTSLRAADTSPDRGRCSWNRSDSRIGCFVSFSRRVRATFRYGYRHVLCGVVDGSLAFGYASVQDVVRCLDYTMQCSEVKSRRVHVIGKGRAGLWCLYAAVLDERISSLICTGSLLSYRDLAQG